MGPLRLYEVFNAMRLHWTTEAYDFIKFRGKVKNLNKITLDQSHDSPLYYNLAKKYKVEKEFVLMLIPLFLEDPYIHISDVRGEEVREKAIEWYRKIQKLPRVFTEDCKTIVCHIVDNDITFHQFFYGEQVLDFVLYDRINIETFIILDRILSFLTKNKKDSILYRQMYDLKVRKYSPFIQVDEKKYRDIFEKEVKRNRRKKEDKM